jgi:hypothetical protein
MSTTGVVLAAASWPPRGTRWVAIGVLSGAAIAATVIVGVDHSRPRTADPWASIVGAPQPPSSVPACDAAPAPVTRPAIETVAILPEAPHGVTASPHDYRLIAVWNDRHVFASDDEGRTFRRVLDGDGTVSDVAFDHEGRIAVVRGDGWLGILDADAVPRERWSRVGRFPERDAEDTQLWEARSRVVTDGTSIAVIGVDPLEPSRLLIASTDRSGAWRVTRLFHDRTERWDTAEVEGFEPAMPGEIQLVVKTWQAGDCGGSEAYHRVVFDPRRRIARSRQVEDYHSLYAPDESLIEQAVLDAAGRWVGLQPLESDGSPERAEGSDATEDVRRLVRIRL